MAIRGIFFDAADVLYRRPEPTNVYVSGLLKARGLAAELAAQDRARQRALRSQAKSGKLDPEEYWVQILQLYGVADAEEQRALARQIDDYSDQVLPIPGNREALAALRDRGFILGIITDTIYPIERKRRWLEAAGVAEFIDVLACSTALGVHKPDPAIYLSALQQANLTPGAAAFVGHAAHELEGARRVGLATVAVLHEPGTRADYYAESSLGLLEVPIFQESGRPEAEAMDSSKQIEAIFIDVGNTMRVVIKDDEFQVRAKQRLVELVGADESPEAFCERLAERYAIYRKRAKQELTEASEEELWTRWMLPDFPADRIGLLAGKLTRLWRDRDGRREARSDVRPVVLELVRRGYRLGIIANTITETEIPDWLKEDGLADYFETVVLSSKTGLRKPGPEIYWEAARRLGVEPAHCMYVGDNPSRDIVGARLAGFGMAVILVEPATLEKEPPTGDAKPDRIIQEFSELLDIFPARRSPGDGS
jgi:putative hydrolase of the HAD superfamily